MKSKLIIFFTYLLTFSLGFFFAFLAYSSLEIKPDKAPIDFPLSSQFNPLSLTTTRNVTAVLVAIREDSTGSLGLLRVYLTPGNRNIFVNTRSHQVDVDTQLSFRIAVDVAEEYTKKDLSKVNIIFEIDADAPRVGGLSAGAVMGVATIAVILNKQVNNSIVLTGTLNNKGFIGPVDGLIEKCKTAGSYGKSLFLIPQGQMRIGYYEKVREGPFFTRYVRKYINLRDIGKQYGINVREVRDIDQAVNLMVIK
jgi:uncharacterized protein